jgi:hypothetical protein
MPMMKATRGLLYAILMVALLASVGCGAGGSSSTHVGGQTGYTNSNLKGSYTFLAMGSDTQGAQPDQYEVGGVLTADGNGNITGEQTYSDGEGAHADNVTGTYAIGSDGLGTITLNTGDAAIGVSGKETLSVVILSASEGLISQFDTSATSSGVLDLQTSTAMPTGGYAFSALGTVVNGNGSLAFGGVFNIDNSPSTGSISGSGSISDLDRPGTVLLNQPLSGSVSAPDSSGKVTLQWTGFGGLTVSFDGYIADATHLQLVETDSSFSSACTAIGQGSSTGTFSTPASFNGTFVFGFKGYNFSGYGSYAGVITADGTSDLTNGLIDQDQGGGAFNDTLAGSYANDAAGTGRMMATTTFGANGPGPTMIFYLTGTGNPIPVLQVDSSARSAGMAYLQNGGTATFSGTYGIGYTSSSFAGEDDVNAVITVTGGTLAGTANENVAFVPAANQSLSGGFSSGSSGRSTGMITTNGNTAACAFYFVDSTRGILIETDGNQSTLGTIRQQAAP